LPNVSDPRLVSVHPTRQQRRAGERKRRKSERKAVQVAAGAALALGAGVLGAPANAATITVNSNLDTVAVDTQCTIREALANANDPTGTDQTGGDCTVGSVGLDTVDLSSVSGTITLTAGSLQVTDSANIQGPGAGTLSISGADTQGIFYMYSALPPPSLIDVSVTGLTLEHGSSFAGAAIASDQVNLTIGNSVLQQNNAYIFGGALAFIGEYGADLTITNTTISGNSANPAGPAPGIGGGIFVKYAGSGSAMLLDHVTLSGNHAQNVGGGMALAFYCGASMTIQNSLITGNDSGLVGAGTASFPGNGGGIYIRPAAYYSGPPVAALEKGTISGAAMKEAKVAGRARGAGATRASKLPPGAVHAYSCAGLTIRDTTISGNSSADSGAGLAAYQYVDVTLVRTTVSGNTSTGGSGGGMALYASNGSIEDSTIANNTAFYYGGGISFNYSSITINNATISGNTSQGGTGGGIYVGYQASGTLNNSIVAGNTGGYDVEVFTSSGASLTVAFSDIQNPGTTPTFTDGGNNISGNPLLGPLQDNGGPAKGNGGTDPTLTMLPGAGSPVIDAGDSATAALPTDERGLPRVTGAAVDMGAVEVNVVTSTGTITSSPAVTVNESAGTVTITLNRTGGSTGPITVSYSTASGTATAGADFTAASSTVSWADGDTTPKTITIPITIDAIFEPPETFTLNLSTSTPGAVVATPVVTVTILDAATVPTLAFWMKLMLALTCAGVGVIMLRNGRLLVVVLAAGVAVAAASEAKAAPGQAEARATARKARRERVAATVNEATTSGRDVSLKIGSETLLVKRGRLRIVDMRGARHRATLESLKQGTPVVLRVRRAQDGSVRRVNIAIFDSIESANRALEWRANR